MGFADEIYGAVYSFMQTYFERFADYLPSLGKGLLVIAIGYFFAWIVGFFVRKTLYRLSLDKKLRRVDLEDTFGRVSLARLFGTLARWFVFFVFFAKGIEILNIDFLILKSAELSAWISVVAVNVILIVLGFVFIDFVLYKVWEIRTRYDSAIQISARTLLIMIAVFTTLEQQGINLSFVRNLFFLSFAAVLLSGSLAIGIGLGIGLSKSFGEIRLFNKKGR